MGLSTGFKKVAQSGKTIDGREIKPEWLIDAAETYNTDTYTAMVFPDHNQNYECYGTVNALKAETDKDGVVSLFADISPNAFWLSDMRYGQNMFTSIAVLPNFAGTGKYYMYSLACTNNPASLGVEKLEFSKKEPTALFTSVFDTSSEQPTQAPTEEEFASFFSRFFKLKPTEGDLTMAEQKELKALQAKFSALETELAALKADKSDDKTTDNATEFAALQQQNAELTKKVTELEAKNTEYAKTTTDLTTQFSALKKEFDAALNEDPSRSTKTGGDFGGDDKAKEFRAVV